MEDSSFKFGVIRATSMEKSNILTISELCEIAGVSFRLLCVAFLRAEASRAGGSWDAADFQQILRLTGFVVTPKACAASICGCCIPASG